MTNILPMYYAFIERRAKKKQKILKAYQAMANDHDYQKEMKAMAEEGMGDYLKILDDIF